MKLKIIGVLFFGLWFNFYSFSQERKIKKAYQEMSNKEFQKARNHIDVYLNDEPKSPLGYFFLSKYFGNESNVNRNLDSCFLSFLKAISLFGNVAEKDQVDYCEEFQFCNTNFKYQKDSIANLAFKEFKIKNIVFSDSIKELVSIISNTKNLISLYGNSEMNSKFMDEINSYFHEKAYLLVKTKNTIVDYSNYIKEYPYSPFVKEANDKIEWIEYLNAKKYNSVELYSNFLIKYPNSKFASEITKLRDTMEFIEAEKTNTIESYSVFIKKYPNSKLIVDAVNYRDKIIISNVIKDNTLASVEEFILKYPNSPQIQNAYDLQSKFFYYDTVGITNITYAKNTKESTTNVTYQKVIYPKNVALQNKINDTISNFISELISLNNQCKNNYESRITYNQNGILSSYFIRSSAGCSRQENSNLYTNIIDLKTGTPLYFNTEFLPDSRDKIVKIIKSKIGDCLHEEDMTSERGIEIRKEIDETFSMGKDIFITNSSVIFTSGTVESFKHEIPFSKIKKLIKPNSALQRVFNKPSNYTESSKQPTSVKIGTQNWSSSDFKGTTFKNGEPIMEVFTDCGWNLAGKEKKSCFRVLDNGTFIYNGFAVQDERGICPNGFSMPELGDFIFLMSFLGGGENADKKIAAYNWDVMYESPNGGGLDFKKMIGNNNSGFNAKPGGASYNSGNFLLGECSFWWTNTESNSIDSNFGVPIILDLNVISIGYCSQDLVSGVNSFPKEFGASIRFIKD